MPRVLVLSILHMYAVLELETNYKRHQKVKNKYVFLKILNYLPSIIDLDKIRRSALNYLKIKNK